MEIKENILCFQYMFFYIYMIYSLFYILIIFKSIPNDEREFLVKAMDYWKKKPIWKMKTILNNQADEPKDMEKYSFGIWPGVKKGCNCSNFNYLKDSCSNEDLSNNCFNVKEEESKIIYKYHFKYFVTYYDSDYLTLLSRTDNITQCKKGFKRCGYLDNLIHPFCVKEEEDCVLNYIYFQTNNGKISLYYGFNELLIGTNNVVNNFFIDDMNGCILYGDNLNDKFLLFKSKTHGKCDTSKFSSIYIYITNSGVRKSVIYQQNDIYNGLIPSYSYRSDNVRLLVMDYYGLHHNITEYYYFDAFIFKYLKILNILVFIFLKGGVQFAYFKFIQKSFLSKEKDIKYNIIWLIIFFFYFIFIIIFNNSIQRSAYVTTFESGEDKFYKLMGKIKYIDISLVVLIILVHIFKFLYSFINRRKQNYSEFINLNK